MYTQKDIARIYIGGDKSYTSATLVASMAVGEIAIQTIAGAILTSGSDITTPFRVVTMYTEGLSFSDWVQPASLGYHTKAYSAAQEQISYLGYNGTTGDMDALASTDYIIRLLIKDNLKEFGDKQMYKYGAYKSNSTTSQKDIAFGLIASLVANFKRDPGVIKCETVSNGAKTYLTGTSDITVSNSSVSWTAATTPSWVVGDLVSIRGITYEIATIASTTAGTFNYAYQGVSETIDVSVESTAVAELATVTKYGIKFTGIANKYTAGTFKYMKTRFEVLPDNFDTAEVTNAQLALEGIGVYEEVEELEWFLSGNNTDGLILGTPPTPRVTHVDSTLTYQYTTIDFFDASKIGIQGTPISGKQIIIAFENGSSQAGTINTMLGTI